MTSADRRGGDGPWHAETIDVPADTANFLATYLPYLLHRADALLSRPFHAALLARGVQASEWRILAILHQRGPTSISSLTAGTMFPQPTVTHAVGRLERRGAVERGRNDLDRRRRIVALTASGMEIADELVTLAAQQEAESLATTGLDPAQRAILRQLLGALIERLDPDSG